MTYDRLSFDDHLLNRYPVEDLEESHPRIRRNESGYDVGENPRTLDGLKDDIEGIPDDLASLSVIAVSTPAGDRIGFAKFDE